MTNPKDEQSRDEFEKYAIKQNYDVTRLLLHGKTAESYKEDWTDAMWEGWQAARAQISDAMRELVKCASEMLYVLAGDEDGNPESNELNCVKNMRVALARINGEPK